MQVGALSQKGGLFRMDASVPSIELNRALQTALSIRESFSGDLPSIEKFGANPSKLDLKIQQFNLSGRFNNEDGAMSFLQFLEAAGQSLNRNRVFDYLTDPDSVASKNDVKMMVDCVRSMNPSIVPCIDNFLKLCGTSITNSIEESRRKNLILAFAQAYGGSLKFDADSVSSSISSTILGIKLKILDVCSTGSTVGSNSLGRDAIRVVADVCFAIVLLAKAFYKGIYFDEVLMKDFHGRINAIEVNNTATDVPIEIVKEFFDEVKALESISVGVVQVPDLPSYLFNNIEHMDEIDWSFSDGAALNDHIAIATDDAIYIIDSSDKSHPSYCIPYSYFRVELEDANTNIIHLYPLGVATFPVFSLGEPENPTKNTVYYTSSTWIEFDTTAIAIKWVSSLEKITSSFWSRKTNLYAQNTKN